MDSARPFKLISGRFIYVCTIGANIVPVSFCMFPGDKLLYELPFDELGPVLKSIYDTEEKWEQERKRRDAYFFMYHDDGHTTEEEARCCHLLYQGIFKSA